MSEFPPGGIRQKPFVRQEDKRRIDEVELERICDVVARRLSKRKEIGRSLNRS